MADIYSHDGHKFSDAGLQLRVPPDLCPPSMFTQLTNAIPIIEGRLEARAALKWIVNIANTTTPGSGLHSISRLNQPSVANVGDRVLGVDTTIQTLALPAGSVATLRDSTRDGNQVSLPTFHFQNDVSAWQIVADRAGMRKYKGGPTGVYQTLGIAPPNAVANSGATAIDGGAGNLNSTGGPGYDWLYTWVNTITQTESNPSDLSIAPSYTGSVTSSTVPDPGFGQTSAGLPGAISGNSAAEVRQSVLRKGYAAATQQMQSLKLYLSLQMTNVVGTTGGAAYGLVEMSLDNGTTWRLITDTLAYLVNGTSIFAVSLPVTQDMTKLQLRYLTLGVGNTTIPQNVTVRRIRDRAGNFDLTGLLTGGGGNASVALNINSDTVSGIDITQTATTLALVNRQATVTVLSSNDTQCNALRLYRRGGSVTAGWAFVGQFPMTAGSGSFTVTDNVADSNLGGFITFTNDAPVNSVFVLQRPLPYVWGPGFNPSRLFGCGDLDRPDAVYFTNPGNADQWGVGQWVDVSSPSDPMQNGCIFNTRTFAFSKERMFELLPSLIGGATVTPFQTPCSRGLISPWGLLATARTIYFVAKDGIYSTTGGEEISLVENDIKPLFPTLDNPLGRLIEGYDSVDLERIEDIRLRFHNDELWFIYRGITTGLLQTLVYDQNKKRWRAAKYPVNITTTYSEEGGPASSLLLGDSTGSLYSTQTGTGDALQASTPVIPVTIRTGAYDQGMPLNQKEYGNVLFDLDPGGATVANPVTITPLLNGEVVTGTAITVTGTGRQQVPLTLGDVFGFNICFAITFSRSSTINPVLYQFDIMWKPEPAQVTHFETRESAYGLVGWLHARDANIAIRSTSTVTLTMTFDGTAQAYSIPSTAGARRKVYIPFHSNKGKVYKFSFDTTDGTSFRLYQSDMELRLKPWVTSLGYQVMKAFGGEDTLAVSNIAGQLLGGK